MRSSQPAKFRSSFFAAVFLLFLVSVMVSQLQAQTQPASRINAPIDASSEVALRGSVSPRIQGALDEGLVSGNLQMAGLALVFTPTAAQQADLQQLLIAQQTPGSSSYHQWLTPAQYAARFGVSNADIAKVEAWLTTEGFTVSGVNNSHTRIHFSGTAGQVEMAFSTEIHHYQVNGVTHLANATALQIPSALAGIVSYMANVTDFRPQPRVRRVSGAIAPEYTSGSTGDHYLTPADLTTIYDLQPLYNAGINGSGERIAIAGQSAIAASDIANFRSAAGLPANPPTQVLVPNTGASTVYSGDESESDIDLEYSGAVAPDASVYFVYVGSNQNDDVFTALEFAVDTDIAPIISVSYGSCEPELSTGEFNSLESVFMQANSQGQTIFSASGDTGATDCDESDPPKTIISSATNGLAVDYPSSSQYVTGVGGTMFNEGSGSYWNSSNSSSGGSATGYIPEEAWNETTQSLSYGKDGNGLLGGGGGASVLTAKPSWQTGTGVPNDGHRDVPDISMDAAVYHDGYLYCSSDTSAGVTGSCSNGFLGSGSDTDDAALTVAGGTSFAAPISAGILALVNQKTSSTGQGNLNPKLYALAASTPAAFHDITVGNNEQPCTAGTTDCPNGSSIGYSAGAGYDQATGLGTLNAANFAGGFSASTTGSLLPTTVTLSPTNPTVVSGTSETLTATVAASSGSGTPTGTVQFAVDGTSAGSPVTLSGGTASYTFSSTTTGTHVVTAAYTGDSTYATAYAVDTVTVTSSNATGTGSFTLTSTPATAPLGGNGTSTITITPAGGYAGTVAFGVSTTNTALEDDGCYAINNETVSAGSPATATLTIYTSEVNCGAGVTPSGLTIHRFGGTGTLAANYPPARPGFPVLPVSGAALFGGALCFLSTRRRSRLWMCVGVLLLAGGAFTTVGCGTSGSSTSTTATEVPAGSYTLTVTGTATANSSITASTNVALTVQ